MNAFTRSCLLAVGWSLLLVLCLTACREAPPLALAPAPPAPLATAGPIAVPATTVGGPIRLTIRDARGREVDHSVDGNALQLVAQVDGAAQNERQVQFALEPGGERPVATCTLPAGVSSCSAAVRADGWAWQAHGLVAARTVRASLAGNPTGFGSTRLRVEPKPVVLVHGMNTNAAGWAPWAGPGGFLEQHGLRGYAVGDGQFGTGVMNTGDGSRPWERTDTIAGDARVMAQYVEAVRAATGAERVDLVGHSLGGLISRYYIQNLMPVAEAPGLPPVPAVNQLWMAGTPNRGTVCARLPAAARLSYPASAQVTPEYMQQVFNPTVHDGRGVPFFAIAGDVARTTAAIRCTDVPTDRFVPVDSVLYGVPVGPGRLPLAHGDLTKAASAFDRVFASLSRSPGDYPIVPEGETTPHATPGDLLQTTIVKAGTLQSGEPVTVTVAVDQASSASFILYAPGTAVTMTIRTVSGAILTEDTPRTNPNVSFERVDDVTLPLSLGYGVIGPRAGEWQLYIVASQTPPGGGQFAVLATLDTGLKLAAEARPAALARGERVGLRATLAAGSAPRSAQVWSYVRDATGQGVAEGQLFDDGQHDDGVAGDGIFGGGWTPGVPGEYSIVMLASGTDAAGNPFERLSVLGLDVGS